MKHRRLANTFSAISIALFVFIGLPATFFGCLGVFGGLADASAQHNLETGLTFLGIALASLIFLIVARHEGWKKQPQKNICRNCGYDLRATPERCPECGTVPARFAGEKVQA